MSEVGDQRRLSAILAADVAGYTHRMEEDTEGTVAAWKEARSKIIDPTISAHSGRTVKLTGDGFLAEFPTVLAAVDCAVAMQEGLAACPLEFRIGVNLGDIIDDGEDIHGEGVNIAARIEALAEPGGICLSGGVFDQVRNRLDHRVEDLGEHEVKHVSAPVRVYRVVLDDRAVAEITPAAQEPAKRFPRQRVFAAAAAVLLVAAVGGILWWQPWATNFELASLEKMALPLPDKPSLAVLPFTNLSNDPDQEVFVDGLTEDLITDLSKISGLFIIARNSTFVYKGKPVEVRAVAETLGVRYVLEGSVRRVGDQLRVNAQLIDATTGGHLWADRFDGEVTNIFAVQDEFVLKIVEALAVELPESEKSEINLGKTDNIEAREAFQRGWELFSNFNAQDNAMAVGHLQKAIELDPEFGRAHAALALVYYRGYRFNWEQEMGVSWNRLKRLTADTLKIAKQHPTPLVHVVAALEAVSRGFADQARTEAEKAVAMQPNDPEAHIAMAFAMIISGRPWEGLSSVQTAMRLNPRYPSSYVFAQGIAQFAIGSLEEAAVTLEEGHARDPKATELLPVLASLFAQLERRQDARDTVLKWRPGSSQLELQFLPDAYQLPVRWALEHSRVRERLIDGLRVAVLPLDTTVSSLHGKLKVTTPFDRSAVIRTLGWFGPSAAIAVPDLIQALRDEHQQVRMEAAITLGKIGPKASAAIPALAAISDDISVSFHAKEALKEIIGN